MSGEALPAPLTGVRLVIAGVGLCLVNFIVLLDLTIANVSVPHIAGGLAVSPSQGTWTITSYAVAEAITVPLTGWLAARFGAVRCLLTGLVGFGFFSLLCGLARSIEALVLFRVLQGLAGGPLMPLTQTLLMRIFPRDKLSTAMSLWGVTTISAPIVGPILGGWISDNMSWPWIFFINLPVVFGCFLFAARMLSRFENERRAVPIDRWGLALLVIWVSSFQLMLDLGRERDWFDDPMILGLAVCAVTGFVAFVIWELFDDNPVVDIRLLRDPTLAVCTLTAGLAFGAFFTQLVIVPLWLQQTAGYDASSAGDVLAFGGMAAVTMAPLVAFLLVRTDPRKTIGLGLVWMTLVSIYRLNWSLDVDYGRFALTHLLHGLGMPFFAIGILTLAMANVAPKDQASAAGIMSFVRSLSSAVATALATTIWADSTRQSRADIAPVMNDVGAAMDKVQAHGLSMEQARAMIDRLAEAQASTQGMLQVFIISACCFAVAATMLWLVPRPTLPLRGRGGH